VRAEEVAMSTWKSWQDRITVGKAADYQGVAWAMGKFSVELE